MLEDVSQLQAMLSAIFVFLGAAVFFVSSFISGRNIFRDVSPQLVLLISTIVGFVLFVFSPISFLVFAPKLFGIQSGGADVWMLIQQKIEHYFFWPFIFSALGFGCVLGTLNAINARALLLNWLRTKAMLNYPILSYDKSWDRFLLSLKGGGTIRVIGKGGRQICAGKLKSFSIREESRELTVEDGDKFCLVNAGDIEYVEAPRESFKRHRDAIAHQAEAFYLSIAVVGLLLLVVSADLTSGYLMELERVKFKSLADLYSRLAMTLTLVGFLFIWISFRVSRQDFCHLFSYSVLCPSVPNLLLIETYVALIFFCREFEQLNVIDVDLAALVPWKIGGVAIAAFFAYLRYKKREIGRLAENPSISPEKREARHRELLEVCELIYMETDLNQSACVRWHDLQDKAKTKEQVLMLREIADKVRAFTRTATFLGAGPGEYLVGEDLNVVSQLRATLAKARTQALPVQVIHDSAREEKDVRIQR